MTSALFPIDTVAVLPNTTHRVQLRAVNEYGPSVGTSWIEVHTLAAAAPLARNPAIRTLTPQQGPAVVVQLGNGLFQPLLLSDILLLEGMQVRRDSR